MTNRPNEKYAV